MKFKLRWGNAAQRRPKRQGASCRWDQAGEVGPTKTRIWKGATKQPDIMATASGRRLRLCCGGSMKKGVSLSQYEKHESVFHGYDDSGGAIPDTSKIS